MDELKIKSMIEGIVIKSTGSWYNVRRIDTTDVVKCRIKGKFRLQEKILTNPVAVGDRVSFEPENGDNGIIHKIHDRKNYVARQSPRRLHEIHLLAANVDQTILFSTIVEPKVKVGFIDRFLLMTEPHDIPTYIVFNKKDIYDTEAMAEYDLLKNIYVPIGYKTLLVSALSGEGINELEILLKGKTTLIAGQSGVGKSTVVNAMQPQLDLRTGDISDYSGKGQHTTTFAEMHPLSFGGSIIDTPGIKNLSFNNLEPMDVAHNFREFFKLSENCRFGGSCSHINEPGCAVIEALKNETLSASRYQNYLKILDEIGDINYWERNE